MMSQENRSISDKALNWKIIVLRSLAALGALALGIYGLLAIDMGRVNIMPALQGNTALIAERHQTNQAANADQTNEVLNDAWQHSGLWMYGMSKITSAQFTYGDDSLFTTSWFHYAEMPKKDMVILAAHNIMGGICMLFGALQFWPALRRKYPKWHRGFGMVYMLTAQLAMIGAATYLLITPVKMIYDSFSFYVGLWILVIVVTSSLWLSIYHLFRREYAQHQAYMAINFGALLTAPILRYNWVFGGLLFPGISFNTANYWGAGILLPECFMLGYMLLCISRAFQQDRPSRTQPINSISTGRYVIIGSLMLLVIAALITGGYYFYVAPDITAIWHADMLIPTGFSTIYQNIITENLSLRLVYLSSLCVAGIAGLGLLKTCFLDQHPQPNMQRKFGWLLALAAIVNSIILLIWAWQLGAPSTRTLAGGTHAGLYGLLTLIMGILLITVLGRKNQPLIAEWGLFTLMLLLSMPAFFWILHLLWMLPIPAEFYTNGQVFRLAADAGPALVFIALFYATHSQATLSKFAR